MDPFSLTVLLIIAALINVAVLYVVIYLAVKKAIIAARQDATPAGTRATG